MFSNAVLSDSELVSACDAEIKDLLRSRQETERRPQNVESIAHRMRANLSAHELVITGLGIKKDMVRVRKKKHKMSQSREKARVGPRDPDQEEIFATGGRSLRRNDSPAMRLGSYLTMIDRRIGSHSRVFLGGLFCT